MSDLTFKAVCSAQVFMVIALLSKHLCIYLQNLISFHILNPGLLCFFRTLKHIHVYFGFRHHLQPTAPDVCPPSTSKPLSEVFRMQVLGGLLPHDRSQKVQNRQPPVSSQSAPGKKTTFDVSLTAL